jgi:hypothetical protein
MAGVVAGAGAGFHWMMLETRKGSSATEDNLEKVVREVDDHHLRRAPARLPSASSLTRRLLLLPAIEFLGVLVLERGSLDWQRLEGRRLGERLGAPTIFIYGNGKEIVAEDRGAYPERFGRWRDFLDRIVIGSFGIQAESYSVNLLTIRLSCGRIAIQV